ncbi:MAG: hypothetical protein JST91_04850 [Actinobacteria bacterium]|nr:hypothetical protein [Actinomycetota bacterium]
MNRFTRFGVTAVCGIAMVTGIEMLGAAAMSTTHNADVCANVGGRRVSVSGCGNIADAVAPWVPPPAEYAPLPEDYVAPPPPPPPPLPNVNVCANVGRRISVSGCI